MAPRAARSPDRRWRAPRRAVSFGVAVLLSWAPPLGAAAWAARLGPGEARILSVQHFTTESHTRVTLTLDRTPPGFRVGRLDDPPRLLVDIPSARLAPDFKLPRPLGGRGNGRGLVRHLALGRMKGGDLRFTVSLSSATVSHRVFRLPDPDRIVIYLQSPPEKPERAPAASRGPPPEPPRRESRRARPAPSRRQRPLGIEERRRKMDLTARFRAGLGRIVLDPGHGGKDPGTAGLYGLVEKNFVLDLARRTRRVLKKMLPGNRVVLTRTDDRFLSLKRRTAIANKIDADVFVSIHANSSPHRETHGIETYLLSEASSARALAVAARESDTTVERMSDLQKILYDLMLRSKVSESHQLAEMIQGRLVSRLNRRFGSVNDLGVKRGPFFVLVGAQMPCILIETAFLTNPHEARRSRTPAYRQALAEGMAEGIARFVGLGPRQAGGRSRPAARPGRKAAYRLNQR